MPTKIKQKKVRFSCSSRCVLSVIPSDEKAPKTFKISLPLPPHPRPPPSLPHLWLLSRKHGPNYRQTKNREGIKQNEHTCTRKRDETDGTRQDTNRLTQQTRAAQKIRLLRARARTKKKKSRQRETNKRATKTKQEY